MARSHSSQPMKRSLKYFVRRNLVWIYFFFFISEFSLDIVLRPNLTVEIIGGDCVKKEA